MILDHSNGLTSFFSSTSWSHYGIMIQYMHIWYDLRTHRVKTAQDQSVFLHSSGLNSCSTGIGCKNPVDLRRASIWPLRAYIWSLFPACVKLFHFRFPFNRMIYSSYYKSAGITTVSGLLYHANYNYYCCRDSITSYSK